MKIKVNGYYKKSFGGKLYAAYLLEAKEAGQLTEQQYVDGIQADKHHKKHPNLIYIVRQHVSYTRNLLQ